MHAVPSLGSACLFRFEYSPDRKIVNLVKRPLCQGGELVLAIVYNAYQ